MIRKSEEEYLQQQQQQSPEMRTMNQARFDIQSLSDRSLEAMLTTAL